MDLEEKAKLYRFFSLETTDEEVFEKICKRVFPKKKDIFFESASERESFDKLYCVEIEGLDRLMIAVNNESGSYEVFARKRKEQNKSTRIYKNIERQISFTE